MTHVPDDLHRGDLLKIVWVDISEDSVGNPDQAGLSRRTSYGLFWSRGEDRGVPVVVTTTTLDEDLDGQNGWCIYPAAVIVEVMVVKRVRRPRMAKVVAEEAMKP